MIPRHARSCFGCTERQSKRIDPFRARVAPRYGSAVLFAWPLVGHNKKCRRAVCAEAEDAATVMAPSNMVSHRKLGLRLQLRHG